jgi:cholesterol transport system auxiliary component
MNGLPTSSSSRGAQKGGDPWPQGRPRFVRSDGALLRVIALGVSVLALSACSALRPTVTPATAFYALDGAQQPVLVATRAVPASGLATRTLLINPPHATAGFDSTRIVYLREPHKLDYYALSQWVDPPARMLGPLLVAAIEKTGAVRAVVLMPAAAAGDLRLDTQIIRLQQEFQTQPSRVRFTLRATLLDDRTRQVLAWQEFDAVESSSSEDAYGGVLAANRAVQTVVDQLARFVAAKADVSKTAPATP